VTELNRSTHYHKRTTNGPQQDDRQRQRRVKPMSMYNVSSLIILLCFTNIYLHVIVTYICDDDKKRDQTGQDTTQGLRHVKPWYL